MDKLTKKELEELVTSFQELALKFLDLDIKYTKIVKKKYTKKNKKNKENGRSYVA